MLSLDTFSELYSLGLHPIPVLWDLEKRTVIAHPDHNVDTVNNTPSIEDVKRWISNGLKNYNGIALKLKPPFGMLDFDLKNTQDKEVYNKWLDIVSNTNDEVLRKVCIETTRSGGYHVYIKYSKLDHKIPLARAKDGEEVISVYTGGLLSYCSPSPNYEIIHGDFESIQELTPDEYDLLISAAALFNEDTETASGKSKVAVIDYPIEYENVCLQFDHKCTSELFEKILNSIGLFRVKDERKFARKKWAAFLRDGSNAAYSAKVYFYSKRLLIFSSSMRKFPTFQDSAKSGDNTWSLSPSKIIFYQNDKDWTRTIEEIRVISDSYGLDIVEQQPVTRQNVYQEERLKFPYDIFPETIQNFLSFQTIQKEYLAGTILMACAAAIGNSVTITPKKGWTIHPILYLVIVAHSGGGKSPAMNIAFKPLEEHDNLLSRRYFEQKKNWLAEVAIAKKEKKDVDLPESPPYLQTTIKDATIEKVINILAQNPDGCILSADEMAGFLNRMNAYKSGDDVQKWLELWNGRPIVLQRVSREVDKVESPFCHIVGGIQVGILDMLSRKENEHNGFYQRFLFVYPKPDPKSDWFTDDYPDIVEHDYAVFISKMLEMRNSNFKTNYKMDTEAERLFASWYDYKNRQYNAAQTDQVKGIIAKYQEYCLRLACIIQVMNDYEHRTGIVTVQSIERAIRLTEYFLGNMHKAIKILTPETPVDRLNEQMKGFYDALPDAFSTRTAEEIGVTFKIKSGTVRSILVRQTGKLFTKTEKGQYEKIY